MNFSKNYFNASNKGLKSFTDIDIPIDCTTLNFSGNYITDFIGLSSIEKATTLILDYNPILSFIGVTKYPNLTNVTMFSTPLSKLKNFRELCVIAFGFQLESLNGFKITSEERNRARSYGSHENTISFLSRGWLPKRPPTVVHKAKQNILKSKDKITSFSPTKSMTTFESQQSPKTNSRIPLKSNKSRTPTKLIKTNDIFEHSEITRINEVVQSQEKDPISVRFVRLMRNNGETEESIGKSIVEYFSSEIEEENYEGTHKSNQHKSINKRKKKHQSKYQEQIDKQENIINILAMEVNHMRSEITSFQNYQQMVLSVGSVLIESAFILSNLENGNGNENENEDLIIEESEKEENSTDDFETLRSVMLKCIGESPDISNSELINKFSSKFVENNVMTFL